MQLRKYSPPNDAATIAVMPDHLSAVTPCSRLLPQPQFQPATMASPGWTFAREGRIEVFERVRGDLALRAQGVGVLAGEDQVGVDVIPVDPNAMLHLRNSPGLVMQPVKALAATT